jgi:hypothetical protein
MSDHDELNKLRRLKELEAKAAQSAPPAAAPPPAATPEQMALANPVNRWAGGVIDAGVGIAQGAAKAIASPMGEAAKQEPGMSNLPFVGGLVGLANNIPGAVSKVADAGMAASEKKYEEARKAVGNTGIDWARGIGNASVAIPAAMALGPVGAAENIATAIATGAAFPVDAEQGYAKEKAKQTAISGVTAGMLEGLKFLATAGTDKFVKTLRANKINPTPGRILGGIAGDAEDKATSLPVVGYAITSARQKALDDLNKAAYRQVLSPIGETLDDKIPVGRESIKAIGDRISAGYEEVLPLVRFKADAEFASKLSDAAAVAGRLPKNEQDVYRTTMKEVVLPQLRNGREVDGQVWKNVDSYLGGRVSNLSSGGPYERDLAGLFRDVQQSLRDGLARTNPRMADRISSLNEAWKGYRVISDAGSAVKGAEGFTPNAFSMAVKRASGGPGLKYSRGEKFMQDLSDAASARLPSAYPDSGTAGRSLLAQGAGLALSPLAIPYLPGFRGAASGLAANRLGNVPFASPVLRGIGATSPVSGAMTPTLQSLLMKKRPEPESD